MMALLKELLWFVAGRGGGGDIGEGKSGDKVNLVLPLRKEISISINKYFLFF
jgi:hypothetical protein